MLTSKWLRLLDAAFFITTLDLARTEWMLLRYAAGFNAGSGGLGMGISGRDMAVEMRVKLLFDWRWWTGLRDISVARVDLELCDLVIFSS